MIKSVKKCNVFGELFLAFQPSFTVHRPSVTPNVQLNVTSVHTDAKNNQSCIHDLKLNGKTVTVTDVDGNWTVGDGRSLKRSIILYFS
jgi:hypothetical protein